MRRRSTLILISLFFTALFVGIPKTRAQSGATTAIGQVEKLKGSAKAFRATSVVDQLKVGDPIYSGDTVQSGPKSRLGIVFADRTVFSLSADATMVINDLVYDPNKTSNKMQVDLVQGSFAFLTGQIAATGQVTVETSVAHIGIRGTQPWITVGRTTSFAIQEEQDGTIGEYALLSRDTGDVIATVDRNTVGTARKFVMATPTDTPRVADQTRQEARLGRRLQRILNQSLQSADSRSGRAPGRGRGPGRDRGPTGGHESGGDGGGDGGGDR